MVETAEQEVRRLRDAILSHYNAKLSVLGGDIGGWAEAEDVELWNHIGLCIEGASCASCGKQDDLIRCRCGANVCNEHYSTQRSCCDACNLGVDR